jgi:hypothetical protein
MNHEFGHEWWANKVTNVIGLICGYRKGSAVMEMYCIIVKWKERILYETHATNRKAAEQQYSGGSR